MAHVELPQEELEPLIQSMKKVFDPLIKALPSLALIPNEISRISDKLDQDMMSGVPERMESVVERFTMDFGAKMLAIENKKMKSEINREKQRELKDKLLEKRESRLLALREKGLAVELKNNRVQFISEKDIVKKQNENLKTQKTIITKEKELQKLIERGEKGSEDKITRLIEELTKLQKTESEQSQVLGDKKKQPGRIRGAAEEFLPEPIMGAFDEFGANISEVGNNLKSFAKPIVGLFKLFTGQYNILEKIQKLNVKKFALDVKAFAVAKAKFALDMLAVLKNPFVLIGIAITAAVAAIYAFKDEIYNFVAGIGESIANFGKSIYNAFAGSAIGKFFGMEKYDMPADEKETPAQIEANNVAANVEAAGPLGALAEARETGTEKLARLKGEAGEMMKEKLATNIVNMVSDNTTQTSVAVNPTVPKSTSADALALNPTG